MKKKAIITVISRQPDTDESDIQVVTPGEFYNEGGSYYAVYDETELSGMEGTRTTLKIDNEKFSLKREGTTNAEMNFRKNKNEITLYNTPYGVLELNIETKTLNINVNDEGGDININYNMGISGQRPQNTELMVNIKA